MTPNQITSSLWAHQGKYVLRSMEKWVKMASNEASRCLFLLIRSLPTFLAERICILILYFLWGGDSRFPDSWIFRSPDSRLSGRDGQRPAPWWLRRGSGPQSCRDPLQLAALSFSVPPVLLRLRKDFSTRSDIQALKSCR